jgi:two-component system phosphate regulon sensor histidine kinase PhoR
MEKSSVQFQPALADSAYRSSRGPGGDRLTALRHEMEYLNTIGKRFVAANDRFQVHRALLATLQELYSFSACSILLKGQHGEPFELSIIPRYPLSASFLQAMIQRIARAATIIDFPALTPEELAVAAYLDAPDDLALMDQPTVIGGAAMGDFLHMPLAVEDRIIGLLSLFHERENVFDIELLQLTRMIADYAAIALENMRLREREQALWREAEFERRRLELIISSMAEALLITNAQGAIVSLNRFAEQLFRQAQVDTPLEPGIPLRQLAASSQVAWLSDLARIIDQALQGQTIKNQELIVGESDETVPLTLSISAAPLSQDRQQLLPGGVVVVLNDITDSKQIEKLKDEFVSVVSHELRTPLTAIKGYTQHLVRRLERRLRQMRREPPELLTDEPPESYDLRSLYIVQSQAEHLERLVSDLLDLSRVQWGRLDLQYSSFYLADLLAEHVRLAQAGTEQHIIQLDLQVQDSKITADRQRVGQVVGNILDNAVKYSPQGGHVTVRLEGSDDGYLVSVSDEGIGVTPEYLDHIFERFYRVRNAASRQYSGIGLGLYVARAIVEAHGGRIGYASNQQGMGSTFYFTLPRSPLAPSAPRAR